MKLKWEPLEPWPDGRIPWQCVIANCFRLRIEPDPAGYRVAVASDGGCLYRSRRVFAVKADAEREAVTQGIACAARIVRIHAEARYLLQRAMDSKGTP